MRVYHVLKAIEMCKHEPSVFLLFSCLFSFSLSFSLLGLMVDFCLWYSVNVAVFSRSLFIHHHHQPRFDPRLKTTTHVFSHQVSPVFVLHVYTRAVQRRRDKNGPWASCTCIRLSTRISNRMNETKKRTCASSYAFQIPETITACKGFTRLSKATTTMLMLMREREKAETARETNSC